ncbi:RND family efflux transporter, MFP subunit [Chitinophaga sp. YR573]|uniref:efflux RND transporter periplasmic adaptor subunit n=1 Tax=Chitinophaga sp. YR573 TaxID=1881040 RepID=UPI0008BAAF04|nr:efflux RND transporter periplasmic adaptor subunit [Chitinophaga sp. YR573]SEW40546.1 RND family efflux transporter, MFP subunit [Chitinophaga sp. YR573]
MQINIRYVITGVIILGVLGLIVVKLRGNKEEVEGKVYRKDPDRKVTIQADTVHAAPMNQSTSFLGAFAPLREVTISSETTGKVVSVKIEEGSMVSAGAVIAQLDTDLLRAQLASAKANYENAISTLKRYEGAASGVTKLQMDNAGTQVLVNKAEVEQYEKQIRMCTIKAPFSGIITSKNFELGAVVATGSQMAQLTNIDQLKLEVNVPEGNISSFENRQSITVVTDVYADKTFNGIVDMVGTKADASHNYVLKILVNNGGKLLKAGMYGRIQLTEALQSNVISVPRSALIGSSKEPKVFVIENGVAHVRAIESGEGNEYKVEVKDGLKQGEIIATGGLVNLFEGANVSIAK